MLTEEEEQWLLDQIAEEEGVAQFAEMLEEECDPEKVIQQGIVADGGDLDAKLEAEMLHFLNSTGQEAAWADNPEQLQQDQSDRRVDSDGSCYSKNDFISFYGGTEQWDAAPPEKKMDEGNPYSFPEFVQYYGEGAGDKWAGAKPQAICTHFASASCRAGHTCKFLHPPAPTQTH